ncbi:hypothetical protein LIER_20901 [Lithospermum erythrorhizon]|uniref:Uncharacterized protein n=1 Tax=Lithospermum erythrorhizon TaxID=34254 RepID=A0AAV3QR74_LITER
MPKKRNGVVISEPLQGRDKDNFVVNDVEDVEGESAASLARRKSKGKLKVNDDRNRINNRRIAKGVEDMNILLERYLSKESRMQAIGGDIGPYWPSIVREFICNLSEDVTDPYSPMFHKVKLRGQVFEFSPVMINRHYGRGNEGITGQH